MGYVGTKGTRLTRLYDANQDFTNENYYQVAVLATTANSTYNALQTTLRLNNWHRFSGFSTYTWSKSLDGASDGIDFNGATAAFPQNSDNLPAEKGPSTFDTRHRWTSVLNYQFPVSAHLPSLLADGWQLNTIVTVQSGRPIGVYTGGGPDYHQRPDIVPGVNPILPNWTPATGYLNPAAFQVPAGDFGNLGRNQIYGPGFWNADFSVQQDYQAEGKPGAAVSRRNFQYFQSPKLRLADESDCPRHKCGWYSQRGCRRGGSHHANTRRGSGQSGPRRGRAARAAISLLSAGARRPARRKPTRKPADRSVHTSKSALVIELRS